MSIFENIGNRDMLVSDLIPIERYDENMQAFLMRNQTVKYMDIIQIKATDLMNKSEYEIDYINMQWAKFFKTCAPDIKLIALNFPTNTSEQQQYMQRKIKQCKNPVFKDFLEIKLAELVDIEKYRSDREYYLMCFAETAEQLNDIRDKISASLITYNLAEIMSKEKKKQILYKYNNPNTALFSVGKENK